MFAILSYCPWKRKVTLEKHILIKLNWPEQFFPYCRDWGKCTMLCGLIVATIVLQILCKLTDE